jgi:tektin-4
LGKKGVPNDLKYTNSIESVVFLTSFFRLVEEVHQIAESVDALHEQLNQSENALKAMNDARMALEKEILHKKNNIFIDKEKCMTHRTRYPTILRLEGYQ